jgi:hypothetical protein
MPDFNPLSLLTSGVGLVGGIAQSIIGGGRERRAENAIEALKTPTYTPNKSILDYYNTALQRYNTNPYQSAEYQYGIQQGDRNTAAGINALQSRNSAVGGISRLIALANDNALKQGVQATNEQNQRFGALGNATNMRARDEMTQYQYNQLLPYQKQLDLLAQKARGGAAMANAGYQNIFGALGAGSSLLNYGYNGQKNNTGGTLGQVNISGAPSWLQNYSDPNQEYDPSNYDYQQTSLT